MSEILKKKKNLEENIKTKEWHKIAVGVNSS